MVSINRGKSRRKQGTPGEVPEDEVRNDSPPNQEYTRFDTNDLDDQQKAFFEALRRAYQDDLNLVVLRDTSLLKNIATTYTAEAGFDQKQAGEPISFTNSTNGNEFLITKDTITFKDGNSKFSFADAMDMAKFAALDKTMKTEGITLNGSREEKALLLLAVNTVNESLPKDQQLKVLNKGEMRPTHHLNPRTNHANARALNAALAERDEYLKTNNVNFKNVEPVDPDIVTDAVYKSVKDHVKRQGFTSKVDIIHSLEEAGYQGKMRKGYEQVVTRLDAEGVTKLNEAGNKRVVLQRDFYRASHEIAANSLEMAQKAVANSISMLKDTVNKISSGLHQTVSDTRKAFTDTVNNMKETATKAAASAPFQATMRVMPS